MMGTREHYFLIKQQTGERIAEADRARLARQARTSREPATTPRWSLRRLWAHPRGRLNPRIHQPQG